LVDIFFLNRTTLPEGSCRVDDFIAEEGLSIGVDSILKRLRIIIIDSIVISEIVSEFQKRSPWYMKLLLLLSHVEEIFSDPLVRLLLVKLLPLRGLLLNHIDLGRLLIPTTVCTAIPKRY